MSYADYSFYKEQYCGITIPHDEFTQYELKARAKVNSFINCELKDDELTDEVRFAVCEVADILYEGESRSGIDYERNDGYWVSYEESMRTDERVKSCVYTWLYRSGLLYRGRDHEV